MTNEQAIETLRGILSRVSHDSPDNLFRIAAQICDAKESVTSRYAPMFSLENLDKLEADGFRGFLLFKNNQHWDNLQRQGGWMTADMPLLRKAIKLLIDENLPIRTRLNRLRPSSGGPMVKGLGRAVITAILLIVYPDKYGVLNNVAEAGMKQLGLWPEIPRAATFGQRYEAVNRVLVETAAKLGIDLWTLDMLWWRVAPHVPRGAEDTSSSTATAAPVANVESSRLEDTAESTFGLERYLHEFLVDNWQVTELGREWDLLEEDGEIVGSYYNTGDVGEIDLLAKHRSENRWLVVELKRNQSSDDTVGQILRYMGWTRRNLASNGGEVEGLIICREIDLKLQYALDGQQDIRCMTYAVGFTLSPAPELK